MSGKQTFDRRGCAACTGLQVFHPDVDNSGGLWVCVECGLSSYSGVKWADDMENIGEAEDVLFVGCEEEP